MSERRVRVFEIPEDFLFAIVRDAYDLPVDAKIGGLHKAYEYPDVWKAAVKSEMFSPIAEGDIPPRFIPLPRERKWEGK